MLPQTIQNKLTTDKDTIIIHIYTRKHEHFEAIIDQEDLSKVQGFRWWSISRGRRGRNYVATVKPGGSRRTMLHHVVVGFVPDDKEVAFLDNNAFNCRKSNLFLTNHATVMKKRSKKAKGLRSVKHFGNIWYVDIRQKGKPRFYQSCKSRKEAIVARDKYYQENGVLCDQDGRLSLVKF